MQVRARLVRAAVAAVAVWLAVSMTVGVTSIALARGQGTRAAKPRATVEPARSLSDATGDGQFVRVRWSGFPAQGAVFVRECVRGATDPSSQCSRIGTYSICGSDCPGIPLLGISDKQGSGAGVAQVAIGFINTLGPAYDPVPNLTFTCDVDNDCSLFVMSNPNDLTTAAEVPISFAPPLSACPVGTTELNGAGNGAGLRYFLATGLKLCGGKEALLPRYRLQTGNSAIENMLGHLADFAVTSASASDPQQQALAAMHETMNYAPVTASGLVLAYRMVDPNTSRRITDLTLSPDLIARIFSGQLKFWNDKELAKLNPKVSFPPRVLAFARGDQCEESLTFTRWIWEHARSSWLAGGALSGIKPNPLAVGPTPIFPSTGQIELVTGTSAEVRAVGVRYFDVADPTSYGFIGYMDSSLAAQYQLSTVRISYPNGQTVAATPKTIAAGIATMKPDAAGVLVPDVTVQDGKTWPMSTVSYAMVPRNASGWKESPSREVLTSLRTLLEYTAGPGQKGLPEGYVPLTKSLRAQTLTAAKQLGNAPPVKTSSPPPSSPPPTSAAPPPPPPPPSSSSPAPPPSTGGPSSTSSTPPVVVVAAGAVPPRSVQASSSRSVLPLVVLAGIIAGLVGLWLLHAERLDPAFARIKRTVRREGGSP